ncbi:restriction endonuclease subunit S [Mesomycoplasma ovipneumoniae]|uniref:restriction endonuclease subunit S n=1 Tax=Mesomycoplasma ovipneumoniae TaxID=29562 RepID=UPI00311CB40B
MLKNLENNLANKMFTDLSSDFPLIRFKGFNQTWKTEQISDLFQTYKNKNSNNLKLISYSVSNKLGFVSQKQLFKNGGKAIFADKSNSQIITKNTFGFNPTAIQTGSLALYKNSTPGLISPMYKAFKLKKDYNYDYFLIWFRTEIFKKLMLKSTNKSVRNIFRLNQIEKYFIKVADIAEQEKISQLFETFENLVNKLEEKIQILKDLKNNLTKKMFTDLSSDFPLIRFKGFNQTWKTEQISDLFQTYKNKNSNNLKLISYSVSNKLGFVSQKQLFKNGGKAIFADKSNSQIITKNTFAFNPSRIQVGSLALYKNSTPGLISPMYKAFKLKKDYNYDYFLIWFRTEIFKKLMLKSTNKSVRNIFRLNEIEEYFIKVADTVEQQKISQLFETFDSLILAYEQKVGYFQKIKKTLLNEMFI